MDLKLLGPPEIDPRVPGRELRRAKERAILAVLALSPGQVVTTEALAFKVWDDDAPSEAVKRTLRSYVVHVKRAVAAAGGASVESAPGGYVLRIDREDVDVHRASQLMRQAEAMEASGDPERAVSLLRQMDGLWRDQALAGLSGRWIESMRYSLHEKRWLAVKRRVGLEYSLGRDEELLVELAELNQQFPDDETWADYRMRVLFRVGREREALAVYQRDYEHRIELGLEASPDLEALRRRILQHDPALRAAPSASPPEPRPETWARGLPPRPRSIVGRDEELALLCDVPDTGRPAVRVVDGMGGTGKSTLAVEAAFRLRDRYPDPPILLRFHAHDAGQGPLGVRDAARQLLELAGAMPRPAPQSTAALVTMWQREAARRRSVIVFDDVSDAATVIGVLPMAGESTVIVTSRRRLPGLPGAVSLSVGELAPDDAVTLFARIAGSSGTGDPDVLSRAVRLCGCLPLALTLRASSLRDQGHTVSEFVAAMEERRVFPDRAGLAVPGLTETFERSYADLGGGYQKFFRRLGTNPCPSFSARTAAVLVGTTTEEAESALRVLYGRHLVERAAAYRYRLHDLLKEYAAFVSERDDAGWERRRSERRLLDYYLNSIRRADGMIYPYRKRSGMDPETLPVQSEIASPGTATKWLELEWRNVVTLVNYAARHEWERYAIELASSVAGFLEERGYWSDGISLHYAVLRLCRDRGNLAGAARAASDLSLLELRTGNYKEALSHSGEAAKIFRSSGDECGVAEATDCTGAIYRHMGKARMALAYHEDSLEIYSRVADGHGMAVALGRAGTAYYSLGRYAEAMVNHERALSLYEETGDRRGAAKSCNNIGDALIRQGRYREAMPHLERALVLLREANARQDMAAVRLNIGHVAQAKGHYSSAIAEYRAALEVCRESGDSRHLAAALYEIGAAYQHQEHYDQALEHHQEVEEISKKIGDLSMQALANLGIADALCGSGSYGQALDRYDRALALALQAEDPLQKGRAYQGMAETRFRMGDRDAARIHFRAAHDAFRVAGVPEAEKVALRLEAIDA